MVGALAEDMPNAAESAGSGSGLDPNPSYLPPWLGGTPDGRDALLYHQRISARGHRTGLLRARDLPVQGSQNMLPSLSCHHRRPIDPRCRTFDAERTQSTELACLRVIYAEPRQQGLMDQPRWLEGARKATMARPGHQRLTGDK